MNQQFICNRFPHAPQKIKSNKDTHLTRLLAGCDLSGPLLRVNYNDIIILTSPQAFITHTIAFSGSVHLILNIFVGKLVCYKI